MYHRVGRLPTHPGLFGAGLTVQTSVFDAQMRWLARHGFDAISEQQLFDALEWGRPPLPPRPVLITFDDGYTDVLWNAEPILHRLHMPATAFVITGRVGGLDRSFLSWPELRDLERDGFAIGSHTVHHLDLTALSPAQAWLELTASREALERHLGVAVDWFSYPAGAENPAVVRLVRRAGYLLAVTTRPGSVQSAREPFLLHRDEIRRGEGVVSFAALLHSEE
jgi:peptidoglycan/xylan/chitin deacetylase (PgdA/CDA1 family)